MQSQKHKKVVITSKSALEDLVYTMIILHGSDCSLNHIDVSRITDFSGLFKGSSFNGDISQWNVSNARNMDSMFYDSKFNGDISNWNVSKVRNMNCMFSHSVFNGDISRWNVSRVRNMSSMFECSVFNGDISRWNVSRVTNMSYMFYVSKFNQDLSLWNVSRVKNMEMMFYSSDFYQDLSVWNVPLVLKPKRFFSSYVSNEFEPKWQRFPKKTKCILSSKYGGEFDDELRTADFEVEITGLDFSYYPDQYFLRYVKISWVAIDKDESDDFELFQSANGQWYFDAFPYDQTDDRPLCAAILRALYKSKLSNRIYYKLNINNSLERIFKIMRIADEYYDDWD